MIGRFSISLLHKHTCSLSLPLSLYVSLALSLSYLFLPRLHLGNTPLLKRGKEVLAYTHTHTHTHFSFSFLLRLAWLPAAQSHLHTLFFSVFSAYLLPSISSSSTYSLGSCCSGAHVPSEQQIHCCRPLQGEDGPSEQTHRVLTNILLHFSSLLYLSEKQDKRQDRLVNKHKHTHLCRFPAACAPPSSHLLHIFPPILSFHARL